MEPKSISIIIPVYNSEKTLSDVVKRLHVTIPGICPDWEAIFVVDGSPDQSWRVIKAIAEEDENIKAVNLSRNFGQHNALLTGIRLAQNSIIITMDDDLQHPPEEIILLLNHLYDGYDLVYGYAKEENHGLFRDLASKTIKKIISILTGNKEKISAFRAFRSTLRVAFADYTSSMVDIDVLLSWGTKNVKSIPVRHDERKLGFSNYSIMKLFSHAITVLTGYSTLPLRFVSIVGLVFTLLGGFLFIYVIINYIATKGEAQGFAFLASAITIFSGIQLFSLGIFGEYLARIFVNTNHQPQSIVYEKIGF